MPYDRGIYVLVQYATLFVVVVVTPLVMLWELVKWLWEWWAG